MQSLAHEHENHLLKLNTTYVCKVITLSATVYTHVVDVKMIAMKYVNKSPRPLLRKSECEKMYVQ